MGNVAIVGAGIAGLVAAYRLKKAGHDVTVYEASDRVGGLIRSERAEGYLFEHGPNTIQSGGPVLDELISELGLEEQLVEASPAAKKRYVVRDGKPVALPSGPASLLASPLFSGATKWRMLREPFLRNAPASDEETVADFFRRRFGDEVLDYAVNPFVAGIFAGDPEELSVCHAFPKLYETERLHGSLIGGQVKRILEHRRNGAPRPRRRMFSFRDGMQAIPDALAAALGGRVVLDAGVIGLRKEAGRWSLDVVQGSTPVHRYVDAVLLTVPLYRLRDLAFASEVDMGPLFQAPYAPVSVLVLGYPAQAVSHPLDGFGMLVPGAESRFQILGALFSSTLFPERAPEGHTLLTVFVGGRRHPALSRAMLPDLVKQVQSDLEALLGVRGEPSFVRSVRWPRAIPQYRIGYDAVKDTLARAEERHTGLYFAGNFRDGISVGDTAATAAATADRIIEQLG